MKTYKHEEIREHNEFTNIGIVGTWVLSLIVIVSMVVQIMI